MAGEKLFGSEVSPACKYCERVFQILDGDRVLCSKRGIIPATSKCRFFVYDPLRRVPQKPRPLEKFDHEDFAL